MTVQGYAATIPQTSPTLRLHFSTAHETITLTGYQDGENHIVVREQFFSTNGNNEHNRRTQDICRVQQIPAMPTYQQWQPPFLLPLDPREAQTVRVGLHTFTRGADNQWESDDIPDADPKQVEKLFYPTGSITAPEFAVSSLRTSGCRSAQWRLGCRN